MKDTWRIRGLSDRDKPTKAKLVRLAVCGMYCGLEELLGPVTRLVATIAVDFGGLLAKRRAVRAAVLNWIRSRRIGKSRCSVMKVLQNQLGLP